VSVATGSGVLEEQPDALTPFDARIGEATFTGCHNAPVARLRSKRSRIVTVAVVVLVLAFCALTLRLFVFPDLNTPARSDAIVVLGGTVGAGHEGIVLAKRGYAPTIAFSVTPTLPCGHSIAHLPTERVLCFVPHPVTTQGEARWIEHMATLGHWHQIIVVMHTTQATRARLRIGRCYPGRVLEVGVAPSSLWDWMYGIIYEWGALVKALFLQPSC
jgi:hypothetical protein